MTCLQLLKTFTAILELWQEKRGIALARTHMYVQTNKFLYCPYSVTVSVTTIKGTECRLLELGRVADITGGQVEECICREFSCIQTQSMYAP